MRAVALVAVGLWSAAAAAQQQAPEVTATMQAGFAALVGLQPYAASAERFRDPAHAKTIASLLATLSAPQHAFEGPAKREPGLAAILKVFGGYVADVQYRFERGDKDYARIKLQTVTSFCFACHTRLHGEKDFEDAGRRVDELKLSPRDQAEFLAATRQFDRALAIYRQLLAESPQSERGYFDFLNAVRRALAITVRVKNDAKATLELLDGLATRKDLPVFLQRDLVELRKAAVAFRNEKVDPAKATPEQLVKKARALVDSTQGARGMVPSHREDIAFLRASNYLHEALNRPLAPALRSEALYLLGVCSAALHEPTLWELDSVYFEVCVREAPHTPGARRCFDRLSDQTYLGYTGSAGTHVPEDELAKLAQLRELAY